MEESTDDCFALIVNWTIDNFSCWNGDVHDPAMTIKLLPRSEFEPELKIELYPKGLSGYEEQLVVRLCGVKKHPFSPEPPEMTYEEFDQPYDDELYDDELLEKYGPAKPCRSYLIKPKGDVSFIASDGSLLCTQQMIGSEVREGVLELPPGPKFRDVVEHIKKNESFHKDQLTVRFHFRHPEGETEVWGTHYMYSMIETFKTTVKIHLEQLKESKLLENITTNKSCFLMEYPLNRGKMRRLDFTIKDSETTADSIELGLVYGHVKNKLGVRVLWSLLKSDGSVLRSEQNEHVFRDQEEWVISNSLTKEEASRKGYTVVIDFEIIPRTGHKFLSHQIAVPSKAFEVITKKTTSDCFHQTSDVLKTDLMCLYQDQDFSDITIKSDNVSFPVHRAILSARSPVFKTMLSTDMVEAASSEVVIGDLDPSTLSRFLTHLYTGAVEEELQCESAINLYYAADKYQVPSLRKECSKFLCANVSISNVCDIMSLAHKHQDDQLTSVSHTLILKNYNEVLASEQWGSFMRSEPLLALETLTQFAKNKKVRGSE